MLTRVLVSRTRDFTCLLSEMDDQGMWDEGRTLGPPKIVKNPGEEHRKTSRGKTKTKTSKSTTRNADPQAPAKTEERLGPRPSSVPIPIPFFQGGVGSQLEVNMEEDHGEDEEIQKMAVWGGQPFWNPGVPESWQFFQAKPERGRGSADLGLMMGLTVCGGGLGMHVPTTTTAAAAMRLRDGRGTKRKRMDEEGGDDVRRVKIEEQDVDVGGSCVGKKSKTKTKTRVDPSCARPAPRGVQAEAQSHPSSLARDKVGSAATKPSGRMKRPRDAPGSEGDCDIQGDEARAKGKKGVKVKKPKKSPMSTPPLLQPVGSRVPPTNTTTTTLVIKGGKYGAGPAKAPSETSQPVSRGFETSGVGVNRQRVVERKKEEAREKVKVMEKEIEKQKQEKAKQEKSKQVEEAKRKAKEENSRKALKTLRFGKKKNEDGGNLDSVAESTVKEEMNVEVVPPPPRLGDSGVNPQSPVSPSDLENRGVDVVVGTCDEVVLKKIEEVPILMPDQDGMEPDAEHQCIGGEEEEGKDDGLKGLKFKKHEKAPTPLDLAPEPVPDPVPYPEKEDPSVAMRERRRSPEYRPRNEYEVRGTHRQERHYRGDGAGSWNCEVYGTGPQDSRFHPPAPVRRRSFAPRYEQERHDRPSRKHEASDAGRQDRRRHSPAHAGRGRFPHQYGRTPYHYRGDDRARPRFNPDDRGEGFRARGDTGWKNKRDMGEWSFVYSRKFWIG